MAQHHGYSIQELENMLPWERSVYISMVAQHVKEENERLELKKKR